MRLISNYKNNRIQKSTESSKSESTLKDIPNKSQVEADDLVNNFSKNASKPKNKESIIIVKK